METISEETFEGKWVIDSETGIQYLIEIKTGKLLLRKCTDGKVVPRGKLLTMEDDNGV